MKMNQVFKELRDAGVEINPQEVKFSFPDAEKDFKELFNYYVPDYRHLKEYYQVIEWLKDNKGKGLALFGNTGQGKSIILKRILPYMFMNEKRLILHPIDAYKLTKEYKVSKYVVIDEVGNEPTFNDYGVKIELIRYIVDEAENMKSLLLLSGNLDGETFKKRYGEMIYNRIKAMCKIVFFKGENLRK